MVEGLIYIRFSVLGQLAHAVAIPVSIVASQVVFSTTGRILDDFRTSSLPSWCKHLFVPKIGCEGPLPLEDMGQLVELERVK